ncbi:hypothetical protein TOT_040000760 [Theileria orientalis strain Shintoku]|uniref:Uncharacterized protein n=1 Tax=Theileria orientalis strain Shintoku TaxID=869250 RepID=J7M8L1_THEOR|nr:hypothetical protein TOT_040000760 [Theileria orientalis strain Shintoku]BAM42393.1 hypothetical protein TOT_040000760 [Theileria orientalis strain Shintoku]|eukprot:XP_009692694.1 hypothetical protein TOT_040000760 [Theileria orientalis strain Shintoku]
MKFRFLLILYIVKLTIADYSKVDVADEASLEKFSPLRGYIGNIEVLMLKAPSELTIQSLEDAKVPVWKSRPTEALREAVVYYQHGRRIGLYVYSIDYFSSPKQSFYIYKRNRWRSSSQDSFDAMLFDRALVLTLGSFTTSSMALIYVLVFLIF